MSKNNQGFSLIEVLMVMVIIGIVTVIAVPWLQKALGASRNGNAFASLRSMSSMQVSFFSQNNRFARLDELNQQANGALGSMEGTNLIRGHFILSMNPITPTEAELRQNYEIIAAKPGTIAESPCVMSLSGSGVITELFGTECVQSN